MNKINFLAAGILLFVISCKKSDDPIPVNKEPSASINIESVSETLWNEVKVVVSATDADGSIASVELYANDQLIGSDAEAPYEFSWNTKDFQDGEVELKAVVTDDLEATTETLKTVEVMNTLIDYDLYEGYLAMSTDYKYFTYITSKSREVLYFEQIETLPYKSTVVRPDDFDDAEFDVHFVKANGVAGQITSYADITPGKFAPVNDDLRGAVIGKTDMTFTDIPDHNYYTFGIYSGSGPLKTDKIYNANVYENLDLSYVYLRTESQGLYKMITLTDGNEATSLSATGFEMGEHTLKIADNLAVFSMYVNGHTSTEADAPAVRLFSNYKSGELAGYEVSYHTPDNETAFDHYSNWLGLFYADGKSYINEYYFDIITDPVKPNINFTLNGNALNNIDLTVSGDSYDLLIGNYYVENNGFTLQWISHSSDDDLEFPVIAMELTSAFPKFSSSNLVFTDGNVNFQAQNFDHLEGYDAYLETISGRNGKTLKDGGTFNTKVGQTFIP